MLTGKFSIVMLWKIKMFKQQENNLEKLHYNDKELLEPGFSK